MLIRTLSMLVLLATLAACGGDENAPVAAQRRIAEPCALAPDARAIFGRAISGEKREPVDTIAGDCRWDATDGSVFAEIVIYTAGSTNRWAADPAADFVQRVTANWAAQSFETPRPLASVGDAAAIVTLPNSAAAGYVRKRDAIVFVLANSIDPHLKSEVIAQRLAQSVAAHLH